jgi:protein phosphatase
MPELETYFLEVIAAGETDRGCRRSVNEDVCLVRADIGLYVVADGAGGHSAGNVASAIAAAAMAKFFDASEAEYATRPEIDSFGLWTGARRLSRAVQEGNKAVIEIARSSNKYRGMGTTIVAALLSPLTGRLHVAHVGDSRCYRIRQGALERLTRDHSILNDVLEMHPGLDDAALSKLPSKAITRALGMDSSIRVAIHTGQALPGDRYLLCSDGVTGELGDAVIEQLLGATEPPADIVRDLVRAAKEVGGRDNVTALVIECKQGTGVQQRPPALRAPMDSQVDTPGASPTVEIHEHRTDTSNLGPPEIVLLDAMRTEEGSDPRISVVPVHSADANMIRALDQVAPALGPGARCPKCFATMEPSAMTCSVCGHSDVEPLSAR